MIPFIIALTICFLLYPDLNLQGLTLTGFLGWFGNHPIIAIFIFCLFANMFNRRS